MSGFEYLKPSVWQDIYNALYSLMQLYQEIKPGYISKISCLSNGEFIKRISIKENDEDEPNTVIAFTDFVLDSNYTNVYYQHHIEIIINESCTKRIKKFLKPINKPKNLIHFLIAHEFGHVLEIFYQSKKLELEKQEIPFNYIQYNNFMDDLSFSKSIVDEATYKRFLTYDIKVGKIEIGNLKPYNQSEILAEAVALDYCKINTKYSFLIVNELNKKR